MTTILLSCPFLSFFLSVLVLLFSGSHIALAQDQSTTDVSSPATSASTAASVVGGGPGCYFDTYTNNRLEVVITETMRVTCKTITGRCGAGCSALFVSVHRNVSTLQRLPPVSFYQHDDSLENGGCADISFDFVHPSTAVLLASHVFITARCAGSSSRGVRIESVRSSEGVSVSIAECRNPKMPVTLRGITVDAAANTPGTRALWEDTSGLKSGESIDGNETFGPIPRRILSVRLGPEQSPTDIAVATFGPVTVSACTVSCARKTTPVAQDLVWINILFVLIQHAVVAGDVRIVDNTLSSVDCAQVALRLKVLSDYAVRNERAVLDRGFTLSISGNTLTMHARDGMPMSGKADLYGMEASLLTWVADWMQVADNIITISSQIGTTAVTLSDTGIAGGNPSVSCPQQQVNPKFTFSAVVPDIRTMFLAIGVYRLHIINNRINVVARAGGNGIEIKIASHLSRIDGNSIEITVRKPLAGQGTTVAESHMSGISWPRPRSFARYRLPVSWSDDVPMTDEDACAAGYERVSVSSSSSSSSSSSGGSFTPNNSPECAHLCSKVGGNSIKLLALPERNFQHFLSSAVGIYHQSVLDVRILVSPSSPLFSGFLCAKHVEATGNFINVSAPVDSVKTFAGGILYGGHQSSHGSLLVEGNSIAVTLSTAPGSEGAAAVRVVAGFRGELPSLEETFANFPPVQVNILKSSFMKDIDLKMFVYDYLTQFGVKDYLGGFRLVVSRNVRLEMNMLSRRVAAGSSSNNNNNNKNNNDDYVGEFAAAVLVTVEPSVKNVEVVIRDQRLPGLLFSDARSVEVRASSVLFLDFRHAPYHLSNPADASRVVRITNSLLTFATVKNMTTAALMRNAYIVRVDTASSAPAIDFGHFDLVSVASTFQFLVASRTSVAPETCFVSLPWGPVSEKVPIRVAFAGSDFNNNASILTMDDAVDDSPAARAAAAATTTTTAVTQWRPWEQGRQVRRNAAGLDLSLVNRLLPAFFNTLPSHAAAGSIIDVRSVKFGGRLAQRNTPNFLFLPRFIPYPGPSWNLTCAFNSNQRRYISISSSSNSASAVPDRRNVQMLDLPAAFRSLDDAQPDNTDPAKCHFKAPCVAAALVRSPPASAGAADASSFPSASAARLLLAGLTPSLLESWWYAEASCVSRSVSASVSISEQPICSDVDVLRARIYEAPVRGLPGVAGLTYHIEVTFAQDVEKQEMKLAAGNGTIVITTITTTAEGSGAAGEATAAADADGVEGNATDEKIEFLAVKKKYAEPGGWSRFSPAATLLSAVSVTSPSAGRPFKVVYIRRRLGGLLLDVYVQAPDGANRNYEEIDGKLHFVPEALLCKLTEQRPTNVSSLLLSPPSLSSSLASSSPLLETPLIALPRLFSFAPAVAVQAAVGASASATFLAMLVGGGGGIGTSLAARRYMLTGRIFSCDVYSATEPLPAMDHPLQFALGSSYAGGAVLGNAVLMIIFTLWLAACAFFKRRQSVERTKKLVAAAASSSDSRRSRHDFGGGINIDNAAAFAALRQVSEQIPPFTPKMLCWAGYPDTLFVASAMLLHGTLVGISLELSALVQGTPGSSAPRAICLLLFCVPVVLTPLFLVFKQAMIPLSTFTTERARPYPSHLLKRSQRIGKDNACVELIRKFFVRNVHWQDIVTGSHFCEMYASAFEELGSTTNAKSLLFLGLFGELLLTAISAILEGLPGQLSGDGSSFCTAVGFLRILVAGSSFALAFSMMYCIKCLNGFSCTVNLLGCGSLALQVGAKYMMGKSSSASSATTTTTGANFQDGTVTTATGGSKTMIDISDLLVFFIFWLALFPLVWAVLQYMVDPGARLKRLRKFWLDLMRWWRRWKKERERARREKEDASEMQQQMLAFTGGQDDDQSNHNNEDDDLTLGRRRRERDMGREKQQKKKNNNKQSRWWEKDDSHRQRRDHDGSDYDYRRRGKHSNNNNNKNRNHFNDNIKDISSSSRLQTTGFSGDVDGAQTSGGRAVGLSHLFLHDEDMFKRHRDQARQTGTYKNAIEALQKRSKATPLVFTPSSVTQHRELAEEQRRRQQEQQHQSSPAPARPAPSVGAAAALTPASRGLQVSQPVRKIRDLGIEL